MNDAYHELLSKARWSHDNRRNVAHVREDDVALARLYAYAYWAQTVGAFHGCRDALSKAVTAGFPQTEPILQALRLLKQAEDLAIVPVPTDFRALLFTLYNYDRLCSEILEALKSSPAAGLSETISLISERFKAHIQRIQSCGGIYATSDRTLPEQGSFQGYVKVP